MKNLLIVGLGVFAQKHITVLRNLFPEIQITALRSSPTAENVAGVKNIYHYNEIQEPFDAALVANGTKYHLETVEKLSAFGFPLMIEKPFAHDYQAALPLAQTLQSKGVVAYTAYLLRFLSCLNYLKKEIEKGRRVHEANIYCGSYVPEWQPGKDFRQSYRVNPEMGGGVHLDLSHEIDYVYWLFGKPDSFQRTLRNVSSLNIAAPDYAHYQLFYPGFTANITLNFFRRDKKRTCEIVFEDETLTADLVENSVKNAAGTVLQQEEAGNLLEKQWLYFCDCLNRQTQPMNSVAETLEVLQICVGD